MVAAHAESLVPTRYRATIMNGVALDISALPDEVRALIAAQSATIALPQMGRHERQR